MQQLLVIFTILLTFCPLQAQHLTAYSDSRGHFFVFDDEEQLMIEELAVRSFDVGGNCILYENTQGHLKCYYNNWVKKLEMGVTEYHATDHLAAYRAYGKLILVNQGAKQALSYRCPMAWVEDSLIVYYDKNRETLLVYYNDSIQELEDGIIGFPATSLQCGDNIAAYVSTLTGHFKVYYQGTTHTLINSIEKLRFKAGRDVVAFVNPEDNTFNAFYKGELIQLETFPPESFQTGDGFIAYVDDMGAFKYFSETGIKEIAYYAPESYVAEDQLLVFSVDDHFNVYWQNQVYELENYTPHDFKMDWNTLVYKDQTNRIWRFSKGKKEYLVNDALDSYDVYRDLVILNPRMERSRIYYKDKVIRGFAY